MSPTAAARMPQTLVPGVAEHGFPEGQGVSFALRVLEPSLPDWEDPVAQGHEVFGARSRG